MGKQFFYFSCACFLCLAWRVDAQHKEKHEHHPPYQKITMVMANSIVTNNIDEGNNDILIIPTIGLNYDYWFHKKWGIGLHNDILLQQYKIERHHDQRELVRENPVAICAILSFEPFPRWILMGGYGLELEKNQNINLFRFGIEYGIPLKDSWELGFNFEYDHKIKAYSSFMIGIGFSKIFFTKRE